MGNLAAEPNILVKRQRARFWIGTRRASKVYPALILKISIWVVLKKLDSADSVGAGYVLSWSAHRCSLSSTEKSPLTACRGSGSTTIRKA